jgi:hypothetical protein
MGGLYDRVPKSEPHKDKRHQVEPEATGSRMKQSETYPKAQTSKAEDMNVARVRDKRYFQDKVILAHSCLQILPLVHPFGPWYASSAEAFTLSANFVSETYPKAQTSKAEDMNVARVRDKRYFQDKVG